MSNLIKRKDANALAASLSVLGWSPTVGTVSINNRVAGYQIGVIVDIGDERIKWEAHKRNPLADFFSIANIAAGMTKNRALKPIGFNWSASGPDSVHLSPEKNETAARFVNRLHELTPPQPDFFGASLAEAKAEALALKAAQKQTSLRM